MNRTSSLFVRLRKTVVGLVVLALVMPQASADITDLASIPLANTGSATIMPNIALILDDSISMDDENMPDDDGTNKGSYCWKWKGYNTLAYNPAVTYRPPIKAEGSRFADSSFTAAPLDGYFALAAKMYDGSTTNTTIDLTSLGSVTTTKATITFSGGGGSSKWYVSSLTVLLADGTTNLQLLNSTKVPSTATSDRDTLGTALATSINAQAAATGSGYSAAYSSSNDRLTITAPNGQVRLVAPSLTLAKSGTSTNKSITYTSNSFAETSAGGFYYSTHKTSPTSQTCDPNSSYNVVSTSADIAAPSTTTGSAAALTNYANWYSFYRKRAFLAKGGIGEAFADLPQDKYRIGFFTIGSAESEANASTKPNHDLMFATFSGSAAGTHRATWFDRLYGFRQTNSTPLRGALSRMGRIFAGKVSGWDPVQYSCQRNFAILTTDGYWNKNNERTTSPKYGPYKEDNSTEVGDPDGQSGVTRPEYDGADTGSGSVGSATNTLADVAYYYYHTDLRPSTCDPDVCTNNVAPAGTDQTVDDTATHQHMTTHTVGFGVDGTLGYQSGYKTTTSGDYYKIKNGEKDWPNPATDSSAFTVPERIDDLWHAAVNGRGTYFSAKDPGSLASGLSTVLTSIDSASGAGAAAATSNLQPTEGDNYIYIANYRTVKWDGNVSAFTIDLSTGAVSDTTAWQTQSLLDAKVTGTCGDAETRTIYTGSSSLKAFTWANLSTAERAYFANSQLTQYADWTDTKKTYATGEMLVNYLRGHNRYEDQDRDDAFVSTCTTYHRLYRDREHILGDIGHSQPVYVKQPFYNYADSGYTTFKSTSRATAVYAAANDGMLHAFDADTGQERWAYIPPMVLKDLYHLAETDYSTNHRFFVDGPIAVSDIYSGGWKTILVGGLGKGGRGYYALDVTDPATPKALWTFSADDNANVGYTYGTPMITKLGDGTWVVVVASGYNNVPEGSSYTAADGVGRVFVLNAATGNLITTISTGAGSVTTPSGLAQLNLKVLDFSTDNTAVQAYGGDLLGNMWRFDLDAGTSSKVAALGSSQPITGAPEIGEVNNNTVLFFGTGRYLGQSDLLTTDTQAMYAIRDDGSTTVTTPSTQLVQQTLSSGTSRTISNNAVDWSAKFGWYVNLDIETKERIYLSPQLYFGTLVFASTTPSATPCEPGGHSLLYFLSAETGGAVNGSTSTSVTTYYSSPIVGITVAKLPGGTAKIYAITADGAKPSGSPPTLQTSTGSASGSGRRVMWREILESQ